MTHLKIAELMARHGVTGQDLAKALDISETTVSHWKSERKMPAIKHLDAIAAAITKLSKIGEIVRGIDLLEDR